MKEKADDTIINQFLNAFITTMPMSAMNPTTSSLNIYTQQLHIKPTIDTTKDYFQMSICPLFY